MPHATAEPQVQFSYEDFVKLHRVQLESAAVPERYWHKLHDKLKDEVFDAGSVFGLMRVEHVDEDGEETGKYSWKAAVTDDEGVDYLDEKHIYLIDHAWSYSADKARAQLRVVPGLAERMAGIMDLKTEGKTKEEIVEEIFNEMWKYNQTYSFANAPKGSEESFAVWYIMDEFGSRIQHSYEPSCRLVPFFYVPMQLTFSILFPVKNLEEGEEITRDYAENTDDPLVKKAKLLPWVPADMTYIGHQQEEPGEEYFEKYRREEPLPNLDKTFPPLPGDRRIKVFTDEQYLQQYLTSDRFELVNNAKDADILWLMEHFFDHKEFSEEMPEKFINQFPHEAVLTVKDLMPIVARRVSSATEQQDELESQPYWLSQTYNLSTELPQFASLFQKRESKGLDNHWICKPYNLSRGLDIHITSNLNYIIKLSDSGPKVSLLLHGLTGNSYLLKFTRKKQKNEQNFKSAF
ncbi:tubulin--tyrosine ligase-like protein 12 [Lingula anatina]|uniref:Tubulin--tyrosine ligase-like protein 12 n=1 Tax=Lingula anatina TaxID=7574 RepID=A0A1S3JGE5_LINAN|nr:tubulin--tyrosine ligase-like protein 12 [Lingula anatina]|eukprot:XP_013409480.1 tubulin--tyrosine ligase-like protein 12 [Lingula anatina]